MTDKITRRSVLRHGVGLAAAAATMTSILDRAYGQEGRGEMELSGGGRLIVERAGRGWQATVIGPDGRRIASPTGLVHTRETGPLGLRGGRVMDGVIKAGDFSQHNESHSQHTQSGSEQPELADLPEWRRRPVLESQANILRERGVLPSGPDLRGQQPRIQPQVQPDVQPQIDPQRAPRIQRPGGPSGRF